MKTTTYFKLIKALKTQEFKAVSLADMERLFRLYSDEEINSIEDIFEKDINEFIGFAKQHKDLFYDEEGVDENQIALYAKRQTLPFESLKSDYFSVKSGQDFFVHRIEKDLSGDKDVEILDIGSGAVPYSSLLFASKGYKNITTMDSTSCKLSEEKLNDFGIKHVTGIFDRNTDISAYDFLTGRKPCDAIRAIVSKCTMEKKPFDISLCTCAFETPNGDINQHMREELRKLANDRITFSYSAVRLKKDRKLFREKFADNLIYCPVHEKEEM